MCIKARKYNHEKDYPTAHKWWKEWKHWEPIPADLLPETGIVVSKFGEDVCMAWLYKTDSNLCWIDWFISNRYATKSARQGAIEHLIDSLVREAKTLGYRVIFSSVRNKNLINKLLRAGFDENLDKNMTNLIMHLGN